MPQLTLVVVILLICIYVTALTVYYEKKPFLVLLLFIVSPYVVYKAFQYFQYKAFLPSAIEITLPISIGDETYFREGCGVAVFKLSESTMTKIEAKGIRFFDGVTQARGHSDNYYKYEAWKETPVPLEWTREGSWFMCSVISNDLVHQITEAAKQKKAYYTTKDEGQLILIPSLGFIVFSFYG